VDNSNKIILDLCGGTGAWSKPYKDAGYTVHVITLPYDDVTRWKEIPEIMCALGEVYGVLAAPPCTMFSYARVQKCKEPTSLRKGMETVKACLEIIWEARYNPIRKKDGALKFWALENPHGYLIDFLGRPAMTFHPYEYGDPYTKKTCLWGNFNEPEKNSTLPLRFERDRDFATAVEDFYHLKQHQIPKGYKEDTKYPMRKIVRSITPEGFARAFFKANR
jgi:hypothetical protein